MASREEDLFATVSASLAQLGFDSATLVQAPRQTVSPTMANDVELSEPDGVALEFHEVLGEGGMGLVRLATQRSLGRAVAVKSLRPEARTVRATLALLREAWVTGAVEHPNVVPVHDIARDETGAPLVVLKKIEGLDWSSLMTDAEEVRARFGAADLLEWNLRVLVRVCDAIAFAHSRGILHRDIKPENVMVGEHGEVYVVDWGLAVTLDERPRGPIPCAREANDLAGTPAYMAPEMLGGQGERLGPATDVYLIGGLLYELLAGTPPHRGDTLMEIVASIAGPPPPLPDGAPEELADLVSRALSSEPGERLGDVRQVQRCIEDYLRHRDASLLARRAQERLDQLELMIGGQRESLVGESAYQLFSECRFGFRHALEVWPESTVARRGLARATEAMVVFELANDQPRTASRLLAEHPDAPPELRARVAASLRDKDADDSRMRAVIDGLDPRTGRRGRIAMAALLGILWVAQPLVTGLGDQLGVLTATHESLVWRNVLQGCFILVLAYYFRSSLRQSAVNRQLLVGAFSAAVAQIVLHLTDVHLGVSVADTTRHQFLVWSGIVMTIAAAVDPVFTIPGLFYGASFVGLIYFPELGFYAVAAGNIVLVGTVVAYTARAGRSRGSVSADAGSDPPPARGTKDSR